MLWWPLHLSLSSSSPTADLAPLVFPHKPCFLYSWCFLSLASEFSPHSLPTSFIRQGVQNRLNNGQQEQNYFREHDVCLFHNSMMFLTMSSLWSSIIPDPFFQWWNCCLVSCCSSCTCVADFSCLGMKLALILIEMHSTSFKGHFSSCHFHFDLSSCLPNKLLVVLVAFYSILLTFWYGCCHQSISTSQDLTEQLDYTFVVSLFSQPLSKGYGLSTWKLAIPRK